jgi:hypothetical protein
MPALAVPQWGVGRLPMKCNERGLQWETGAIL